MQIYEMCWYKTCAYVHVLKTVLKFTHRFINKYTIICMFHQQFLTKTFCCKVMKLNLLLTLFLFHTHIGNRKMKMSDSTWTMVQIHVQLK